jgi:4-diphosphocytidyl-2-C-methyl-D-erythritol kinase
MTTLPLHTLAPAKINLGLFLGPTRADGRHELVTVMQSISLADELTLRAAPPQSTHDAVLCPGVEGPPEQNLAAAALAAFRAATHWDAPPLELNILKRVPIAAGLGGGSGDAAAALRLAAAASGLGDHGVGEGALGNRGVGKGAPGEGAPGEGAPGDRGLGESGTSDHELLDRGLLEELARTLGADVPAQVEPGRWLARGAGELLQALPEPVVPLGVLVLPVARPLSTAAVYAQADRMGLARACAELEDRYRALASALADGSPLPPPELLRNDLQDAARALCPEIDPALAQARETGADVVLLSGSGPTVLGLFPGSRGPARARAAARSLAERVPAPLVAEPVTAGFAQPTAPG